MTDHIQMNRNVNTRHVCLAKSLNQNYSAETHAALLPHMRTQGHAACIPMQTLRVYFALEKLGKYVHIHSVLSLMMSDEEGNDGKLRGRGGRHLCD